LIIESLPVGAIMANCYILGCDKTREAVVIDPGGDTAEILKLLAKRHLRVVAIVNTHGHFDHVGGNKRMKDTTRAPILIHAEDAGMLAHLSEFGQMFGMRVENSPPPDRTLAEGDTVEFGHEKLHVLHTPGHSPGGIALLGPGFVVVGDTLFAGSIGRTDFPGGNYEELIRSVRAKLFVLDDRTVVYCGHGPNTTIGREKRTNPFFQ
jgi:glyoxylase-like metal-dependent hydrolase (beta-lactamase superfamily II)